MAHMRLGFFCQRIFPHDPIPPVIPQDLRTDAEAFRTVVGISDIFQVQRLTDHCQIRIGKYRKKPFFHDSVKSTFFIE